MVSLKIDFQGAATIVEKNIQREFDSRTSRVKSIEPFKGSENDILGFKEKLNHLKSQVQLIEEHCARSQMTTEKGAEDFVGSLTSCWG